MYYVYISMIFFYICVRLSNKLNIQIPSKIHSYPMNEFNPFLQIPLPPYRYLKQDKQSQSIPVLQLLTKVLKNIHPCTETSRSFPYIPASALTFL